jgi:hypothetical protein
MRSLALSLVIVVAALSLASNARAQDGHDVKVTLAPSKPQSEADRGIMISVDVVNTGKVPVFVFNPNLPTNDRPTGRDLYDVVDAKCSRASFVGEIWDEHPETTNFTRIDPGQHIVSKYDLGRNYKLTPGPYEISFKPVTYYSGPYDVDTSNVAALRLGKTESNTLKLWINDALLKKQSVALLKSAGGSTFGTCSATQTTAATSAFGFVDLSTTNCYWGRIASGGSFFMKRLTLCRSGA